MLQTLSLTDDTVLEEHNEDPALIQMRLLDDGGKKMVLCFTVHLTLSIDSLSAEDLPDISSSTRVDRAAVLPRFMTYTQKGKDLLILYEAPVYMISFYLHIKCSPFVSDYVNICTHLLCMIVLSGSPLCRGVYGERLL